MYYNEPTLNDIEDYNGKGSLEKRLTVWVTILSGLLIGSIVSIVSLSTPAPNPLEGHDKTAIIKY